MTDCLAAEDVIEWNEVRHHFSMPNMHVPNKPRSQSVESAERSRVSVTVEEVISEAELIKSAAEGNLGAFAQLVAIYRPRVIRTAYGIVGSPDEAEDVAQEVFIKVWSNLAYYNAQGAFASWLYRITTNAAIDSLAPAPSGGALGALPRDRQRAARVCRGGE